MDDINLEKALNDSMNTISNAEDNYSIKRMALAKIVGIRSIAKEQDNNYLENQMDIIHTELTNNTVSLDDDLKFLLQRIRIINKHIQSGGLEVPNKNIAEVLSSMEKELAQKLG